MKNKTTNRSTKITKTTKTESNPNAFTAHPSEGTQSQVLAKLVCGSALSAATLKQYSGAGDVLEVTDMVAEMRKAGDEAVAGEMDRVERMLANQLLTLDLLFNSLAQRSGRQDTFKGIEVLMRLALKAQSQARATAETLSIIKNPMPYIKQANIAQGHQQINNGEQKPARAEKFRSQPNKLLEQQHGHSMDSGASQAASRIDQELETVGKVHRPHNRSRKSTSSP